MQDNTTKENKATPTPFTMNEDGTMTVTLSARSVEQLKTIQEAITGSGLHKMMKETVEELIKDRNLPEADAAELRKALAELEESFGDMVSGIIAEKAEAVKFTANLRKAIAGSPFDVADIGSLFGRKRPNGR